MENETDLYLLGWIDVVDELIYSGSKLKDDIIINEDDINNIEVILVAKEIIMEFLDECGLDIDTLINLTADIRNGTIKLEDDKYLYKNEYDKKLKDFHITKSGSKQENPIMINIRKEKLFELGNKRLFIVSKNGVQTKRIDL